MNIKKIFQRSIFFKFIIVIITASIFIHIISILFFSMHLKSKSKLHFIKSFHSYLEYILNDIGTSPNEERIKAIALKNGISLKYKMGNTLYTSDTELPEFNDIKEHIYDKKNRKIKDVNIDKYIVNYAWDKGKLYVIAKNDKEKIMIKSGSLEDASSYGGLTLILILITTIMFLAYLRIKKILSPLKDLENGVQALNNGNFSHRVPVKGIDELSRLAKSFNSMSETIGSTIETRRQLLLDVSHELRSPLTRIKMALEFMKDSKTKYGIKEDVDELDVMLGEILESERLTTEQGKLKEELMDLNKLTSDVIKLYNDHGEKLIFLPYKQEIIINGDSLRLKRVIKNIVDNAIKYTEESSEPIELTSQIINHQAELTIKDYGKGIPNSELHRIFEPFYRVDRSRSRDTGGYGLGMSISKKIIEMHSGSITLESIEGKGTTVLIRLPLYKETHLVNI